MRKTQDTVVYRRRAARRALVAAASGMVLIVGNAARADDVWAPQSTFSWNNAANWTAGIPTTGTIVDIFTAIQCNMNVASTGDLAGVQIANGGKLNLITGTGTLETANLYVGGTNSISGSLSNSGAGTVTHSIGTMQVDLFGVFSVDSNSTYSLSGSGLILSSTDEQLAGNFSQLGGTNQLTGASLINSGLYAITGGNINCDSYSNTFVFNQSSGTLQGAAAQGSTGTFNFNNGNGSQFNYTGGNFYGVMNNSGSVQVNAATVPFTQNVINNGSLTINGSSGTFSGNLSGGGILNFKGGVNLTVTGNNNYSGSTTVTSGTLMLNSPAGNKFNNYGGALQGPVTIQTGATIENLGGNQISGISTVYINGGTYNLNGYDNSVGALNFSTGNVITTSTGPGIGLNSSPTVPGIVYTTRGASSITGGIRCSNTVQFNVSSNAPLTVTGAIGGYPTSQNAPVGIPMILIGGGTLYFSGASQLTTIDIKNGTLVVNEGGSLGGFNTLVNVETGGSLSLGNQSLTIGDLTGGNPSTISLGTGSLTVTSITGTTYPGTFSGSGTLAKSGPGTLTLTGAEASTGAVTVNAGTLTLAPSSSLATTNLTVLAGATVNLNGTVTAAPAVTTSGTVNLPQNNSGGINNVSLGAISVSTASGGGSGQINVALATPHPNRTLLQASSLSFAGSTGGWVGQLDLANNDMIIHNANLGLIVNAVKTGYASGSWNGTGIASSAAAADPTHLTAIGVISNDLGHSVALYSLGSNMAFDNNYPVATDTLLKYTYYGDANLDGQVNSTDYSLIDNGFLTHLTGWYNGDFNYDGVVNGSDYTLIDNAFNTQGSNLSTSAQIASSTAQLATSSSVPEPTAGLLLATAAVATLRRRCRRI